LKTIADQFEDVAVSTRQTPSSRRFTKGDYKVLALTALGGALEFYDFVIFVFFTNVLGNLFFPPDISPSIRLLQTFGIFAAGYFIRPLGGLVMAHFGDLYGRKKMFALSVLLMTVPTLLIGFLPTYQTIGVWAPMLLLLMRLLQGAAVGGEVPGAWVFVSEHVPTHRVGLGCGLVLSGLVVGIVLGSSLAGAINTWFTPAEIADYAWRIPFIVGGFSGAAAVYLRLWLEETPVFTEMKRLKTLAAEAPLKLVCRDSLPALFRSALLIWMLSTVIVIVILMMPTLMQRQFHIPAATALFGSTWATISLAVGGMAAGALADRFGPRIVIQLGSMALAIAFYLFYRTLGDATAASSTLPLFVVTGFLVGTIGAIPSVLIKAFPAATRFTGVSFSYNVAYAIFGGTTPILVGAALLYTPLAPVYYVAFVCVLAALVISFVPKTGYDEARSANASPLLD
jgi:MFS family permease